MDESSTSSLPDVVYKYAYNGIKCGPYAGNLSALVVTSSGEVYGAGANTLVRSYMYYGEFPMKEGGPPVLDSWVKIDHLSGIGIKKIIVGEGFGAALIDDQLLTWGYGVRTFLGKQAVVMFQEYQEDTGCRICKLSHDYVSSPEVDNVSLSYCDLTNEHPVYTPECPPPHGMPVKRFLRYNAGVFLKCRQCMRNMSSKLVSSVALFHCPSCHILWDVDDQGGVLGGTEGVFSTNMVTAPYKDIAPHSSGIWILMQGNELVWCSFEKRPTWTGLPAQNPENHEITAVYNAAQILVTTDTGHLYRINPRTYVLEACDLPSTVIKVCCGFRSVACLLANKSIWIIHSGSPEILNANITKDCFEDIASAQWCDTYYVKCRRKFSRVRSIVRLIDPDSRRAISFKLASVDPSATLLNTICGQHFPFSSSALQVPLTSFQHKVTLPPFQVELYGRKFLSDMTLKLSTEDFPAHRCVLLSTSTYFNKTLLTNREPHITLDMTSYNPKAYKSLLKYYYQLEPDDLDVDSLLDLYVVADSYEETEIACNVEEKIKDRINIENVLHIFGMSKLLNIETIKTHSESLMRTSTFKEQLLEKAIKDPMMFLVLLE